MGWIGRIIKSKNNVIYVIVEEEKLVQVFFLLSFSFISLYFAYQQDFCVLFQSKVLHIWQLNWIASSLSRKSLLNMWFLHFFRDLVRIRITLSLLSIYLHIFHLNIYKSYAHIIMCSSRWCKKRNGAIVSFWLIDQPLSFSNLFVHLNGP